MTKLRLHLDDLAVESFQTATPDAARKGTVQGHAERPTLPNVCDRTLLVSNPTCCPCTPMY